jgi:translation elongation factor EF-Tu-like GTPase
VNRSHGRGRHLQHPRARSRRIETGRVELGQRLCYTGPRVTRTVEVSRIENFRQPQLKETSVGPEDVGLELTGISVGEIAMNDMLIGAA